MSDTTNIHGDYVGGDYISGDKIMGDKHTHHHYPPPKFPLDNLPPHNLAFTGRHEELAAIVANFSDTVSSSIVLTQAIAGLGGVGKTQLALAYAHAHRDEYDLIWQLRANDTLTLDTDLRQLGETLNLPVRDKDTPTARRMVLSWLNGSEQRWLLLFDNADEIKPRDLRPYLPSGGGHVIITSRRATAQWQRMAHTLTLDVFTAVEAAAFWQKRGLKPEPALAEALGHLPLALEQAVAYMTTLPTSAANYLTQFQQRRRELWAREEPPDDYHATIMTTWQMAFDHARQTAGAAALLNLCCFLAPDDIPLDIIQEQAQTLPDELATVMADELALADALTALQNYSLIIHVDGMLNIHRLVQAVARERMGAEPVKAWGKVAIELLIASLPDWTRLHEWPNGYQILPHMIAVAELGTQFNWETEQLAFLCNWTGYYLQYLGDYVGARPSYERALAINEKQLGSDHPDTALSLNNLGGLLETMGEYGEALPFVERALAINKKQFGSNHRQTALSLNNLGVVLKKMGELEKALPLYACALAINEKQLGSNHPQTALSLNNLGGLLQDMKEYEEARSFFERALVIWEAQPSSDHLQLAACLNNLGLLLGLMGEYGEELSFYERALALKEKQLGPNHPHTAQSLHNLACLLHDEGDKQEAARLMRQALAIREKALGNDHPDTQKSRQNLATIEAMLG